MPTHREPPNIRRPLFVAMGIFVVLYVVTRTDLLRFDLDPHARTKANAASGDALWRAVPVSAHERQRWTILKQADWFSWGQKRTIVGRRYDLITSVDDDLDLWVQAGKNAGWVLTERTCPSEYDASVTITLTKTVDGWPAQLEVAYEGLSNTIRVNIIMEAPSALSGATVTPCRK